MARMFDTKFSYEGVDYTATVTISNAKQEQKICVDVPDKSLQEVLPGGKIVFEGSTVKQVDEQDLDIDPRLIKSLREAIETHEKDQPEVNLWS